MTDKPFNSRELSTIRMALVQWEARCVADAKCMRDLATHFDSATSNECERNALASEAFADDARAILDGGAF